MAMFKGAQYAADDLVVSMPTPDLEAHPETVVVLEEPQQQDMQSHMVELQPPSHAEAEICFTLSQLPGADDDEVSLDSEVQLEEEPEEDGKDKSKAADQPRDLNWLKSQLDNIPKHRGETLGIERALSYLHKVENMLSKMIQEDHEGKIEISKAEEARIEIENGIERLEHELNKRKKKKAAKLDGLTKSGQKAAGIGPGGVLVTVPLIVSSIARTCINSTISGGKSIEDTFKRLADKYKLSDREKTEVIQLLHDMNFPFRADIHMLDGKDHYEYSSENNISYPPNYQA